MSTSLHIAIYIAVMAGSTAACRVLPLTLIRRPIENRFFQSFLYYVPYVTLAVMTFPAILDATLSPYAGAAALIAASVCAWFGGNLFLVAGTGCAAALVLQFFL